MLATQYEKTAATSLAETEASAYTGQGFEISLDITPAQSDLAKIEYVVEVAETQMIEDAIITTEYDYETEIKGTIIKLHFIIVFKSYFVRYATPTNIKNAIYGVGVF